MLIRTSLNLADFDHAMFWVAFCTAWFVFLRVSEFTSHPSGFDPAVHLSLHDVAVDSHLHPSAVFLTLKASKTDPFRKGVQLYLPRTDRLLCPVSSLYYSSTAGVISQALCSSSRMVPPSHAVT